MPEYPNIVRPEIREQIAAIPCPLCGETTLQIVARPALIAKPFGSYSLAGQQDKVSAVEGPWPWLVCSRPECSYEEKAKR